MSRQIEPRAHHPLARWILRSGRPLGVLLMLLALVGTTWLHITSRSSYPAVDSWPTEGYYFAGAQYQLGLQALQLEIARYHLSEQPEARAVHRRDALVLRDVLHAKYAILMDSPELRPYLDAVEGFRSSIGPLTELNSGLDDVVESALASVQGYRQFEAQVEPLSQKVVSMANDLRVAELVSFEAAFEAQRRATFAYQEVGLVLLFLLGVGLVGHVYSLRKEVVAFRKEAEARAEAQRSAQARAALLGMVSHELRTPLQTMLADVEVLADTSTAEVGQRAVGSLERNINLISGQLDDIAQYTRLVSGTYGARRERFALVPMLQRIVDEHRASIQPGQQLVLDSPLPPDLQVEGDPIRLHQIINNFLSNAIKYGDGAAIAVSAELEQDRAVDTPQDTAMAVVRVRDHGPGIADSDYAAIWEPFVRGRRGQGRSKGSGLGLAVVRLLADSIDWKVGVINNSQEQAGGATFFVRFPLSPPNSSQVSGSALSG
ncbi:HAMP domain-containing sensor histidine kinase [Variovorax sp. J22R133]|uniref:sensor histidine kinase n=1 Tax=Variovorax brevis TaxID=3053503 RepID=UPI0025774CF2|nr:HAMP domain-containing sensor histidine kinase [Variovorax sp. J22R133]MDM0116778.1 HAMP domain-containing sensor histidine kinase [Variovorax sp. J22R133]